MRAALHRAQKSGGNNYRYYAADMNALAVKRRVYSLNPRVRFSSDALVLLEKYSWPGNIRELENAIVRAAAMCDGIIRAKDLPERMRNHSRKQLEQANSEALPGELPATEEWSLLSEVEGRYVAKVLAHTVGNKQAAARLLGIDRKTLDRMIKRHNLSEVLATYYRESKTNWPKASQDLI